MGKYVGVQNADDTLNFPRWGYEYNEGLELRKDSSFIYFVEENPEALPVTYRQSIRGSWNWNGDTITFFNENFRSAKGIKINYLSDQNFDGIKIVLKDYRGSPIPIEKCWGDSIISKNKIATVTLRYFWDVIYLAEAGYSSIYVTPRNHCIDFRKCEIEVDLSQVKKGTLIEVVVSSHALELEFDKKKVLLKGRVLFDLDSSQPTFIRKD